MRRKSKQLCAILHSRLAVVPCNPHTSCLNMTYASRTMSVQVRAVPQCMRNSHRPTRRDRTVSSNRIGRCELGTTRSSVFHGLPQYGTVCQTSSFETDKSETRLFRARTNIIHIRLPTCTILNEIPTARSSWALSQSKLWG